MNSFNVPIYRAIKEYTGSAPIPFHMPGHKLGRGIPEEFASSLLQWDLTEIPGTDNLHFPTGAIQEAQKLAAEAFGADESFFLVNGSTCGIHAMILAVCRPGDKLIVGRDCHKSVINGLMLAGTDPVYLRPEYDTEFGIPTMVTADEVEGALARHPDAAGVLITRPNYYGVCSDLREIARITHRYGKVLLVDEAHGAHFCFHRGLPVSAMEAGADACVQSAHKTLPALTQGAYLHIRGRGLDAERLRFYLRLLQTSSPSYILMAYLDIAREMMQRSGNKLLSGLLTRIRSFKERVVKDGGLDVLREERYGDGMLDGTRLVINTRRMGKTGFEVEEILRKQYGIQVEMADLYNIVCIGTVADCEEAYEALYRALYACSNQFKDLPPLTDTYIRMLEIPEQRVSLRDIPSMKQEKTDLSRSAGRISSTLVTPYPPGIPLICPGEIIMADAVENIYNIVKSGGTVNGLDENGCINVVA